MYRWPHTYNGVNYRSASWVASLIPVVLPHPLPGTGCVPSFSPLSSCPLLLQTPPGTTDQPPDRGYSSPGSTSIPGRCQSMHKLTDLIEESCLHAVLTLIHSGHGCRSMRN